MSIANADADADWVWTRLGCWDAGTCVLTMPDENIAAILGRGRWRCSQKRRTHSTRNTPQECPVRRRRNCLKINNWKINQSSYPLSKINHFYWHDRKKTDSFSRKELDNLSWESTLAKMSSQSTWDFRNALITLTKIGKYVYIRYAFRFRISPVK